MNLAEISRKRNVKYSTLYRYSKLHPDATVNELVKMAKNCKSWGGRGVKRYPIGDTEITISEGAELAGVNVPKFRYRVKVYGMKKAIAIGSKDMKKGRPKGSKTRPFNDAILANELEREWSE